MANDPNASRVGALTGRPGLDRGLNLLGRAGAAFLFLDAARYHVSAAGWTATLKDMAARGIPMAVPALVVAMIVSSLLALALLAGFRWRWAAAGLALYTICVSSVMYTPFSGLGYTALVLFLKDIGISGALLALATSATPGSPRP